MREIAIGDIHGCIRSLNGLLETIQPQKSDTLIFLGDYIDRGPDSYQVIETIIDLNKRCNVVALMGNHEQMLGWADANPESLMDWLRQGGNATLDSYRNRGMLRGFAGIPERHRHFIFEQTLAYWETDERIYVHASVEPETDLFEQTDLYLLWEKFRDPMVHKSGKQIICGHTSQKSGLPAIFKGGVCIDTWVYGNGWLTGFDTGAETFFQTNERGGRRTFPLQKLVGAGDQI
ncbi:MAG TPA: metallophosphoesterase family protein [Chthoniobacteraceae bacterium]|jgi:serine/threonine protein phosphatase 1